MSGVFINYRGEDSDTAAALIDRELAARWGSDRVFLDCRSIPAGVDFAEELLGRLRACSILVVVIGPRWLALTDAAGRRRIDDPQDWIRREIAEALTFGLRVIPVLTGDAALPAEAELPADIVGLSRRQYVPLRCRYTTVDLAFLVERVTEADPELAKIAAERQSTTGRVPQQLPTEAAHFAGGQAPRQLPAAVAHFAGQAADAGRAKPAAKPTFPAGLRSAGSGDPRRGELPDVWNLPPRNPGFIARAGELEQVRVNLAAGSVATVQAVRGMGGVGKTQAAIEYAYRHAADYELVWWIDAENPQLITSQVVALGAELGLPRTLDTEAALRAVLAALRRHGGRWLLIFDNAEDVAHVQPALPGTGGHVLITTRRAGFRALGPVLDLDVLTREDATTLLRSCAPHLNQADADMLADRLGDLPLALTQAGAYLDRAQLPAADYLRLLDTHAARLFERGHAIGHAQTIATLWSISLDQLRAHHPAAVQLLHLCAWLAPEPIPIDLITSHPQHLPAPLATAAADPLAMADTIAALADYSLVRRSTAGLLLHRLVQAVIRESPYPGRRHPLTTVLALLHADLPDDLDLPASWPRWRQLLPHVLAATDHPDATAPAAAAHTAWLLDRAGSYIHMFLLSDDLRPITRPLERSLRIRENLCGPDHPETAATLTRLGLALYDWRQDAAARPVLERALRIAEASRGSDHPDTGTALDYLGLVLVRLGEPATAVPLLERALNITESRRGIMHPQTATVLIGLSTAFRGLGQMDAAQRVMERGLAIRRMTYGAEHPWTGSAMTKLGSLLVVRGEPAAAKPILERALRIRERAYGAHSLVISDALVPLGRALTELGEPAAAHPLLERAVTLSGVLLGTDHPTRADALRWLGNALRALGEPTAARPLLEQALSIQQTAYGPDHPWTANTMIHLSHVLSDLGETTAATALHAHASHIHQATYGPDQQPGEPTC